jgi:NAD(P)-dependent dehydrogenase (short-subunit alcohol dehydrogenase family)
MASGLAGKVALVTGAGSGIGRASALAFAAEGARVVVADIDVDGGAETVAQITVASGEAIFVAANVARAADAEAMVTAAVRAYGRLDCALNNAGIVGVIGPLHLCPEAAWDQMMGVNLKGVWLSMKYEIAQMLAQGGGAIVNLASLAGLVGAPAIGPYCASKHGVVGLMKTAALEYIRQGVRVNAVCPGFTRTRMLDDILEHMGSDGEATILRHGPSGRFGTVEEVAATVVWLCSDAASYINGQALAVDGGVHAR